MSMTIQFQNLQDAKDYVAKVHAEHGPKLARKAGKLVKLCREVLRRDYPLARPTLRGRLGRREWLRPHQQPMGALTMNRQEMIDRINAALPIAKAVPSEVFDPDIEGAIWLRGSEYADDQGLVFDAYGENELHPVLEYTIEAHGWTYEPYDAGTLLLYPEVF